MLHVMALSIAAIMLAPGIAGAQGGPYARVSFSFEPVYESNLFAAARDEQGDVIFRVGPAIEAGYLSSTLTLLTHYRLDAERYGTHAALSKTVARQNAVVDLRQIVNRRLTFEMKASYLETRSPYELNLDTALAADRARATRLSAAPAVRYQLRPATRLNLGFGSTRDALAGRGVAFVQDLSAGVERQAGRLKGHRIDYRFRHFDFGNGGSESVHVLTAGGSRAFTRRTGVEIALGPRLGQQAIRPELTASLWWRVQKGYVSGGYGRTHATVIGETGLIDVQRVFVSATYRPERRIRLSATPAFVESVHDRSRVSVYALDLEAIGWTTRGLSVAVTGRIGQQQGSLFDRRESIATRSLSVRLITAFPRSTRDGGGPPPLY